MERLDDLLIDGMKIYQDREQFCFSIDAVILAHFPTFKDKGKYIDLGTGTGVIPLLASSLGAKDISAIELNPRMARLAKKSVDYNHRSDCIHILQGDYRNLKDLAYIHSDGHTSSIRLHNHFDGILMNPPYYGIQQGKVSPNQNFNLALHEDKTSLVEAIDASRKLVKYKGKLWLIYLASRLSYVMTVLLAAKFEPKRLRFVHSFQNGPAKLVLVEAVQGGQPGLTVDSPLYIYKKKDIYSEEVMSWYER